MTDAMAVAREVVDYYRGVCRGVGLNDLPFEHRLVQSIAAALREHEQQVLEVAARRLDGSREFAFPYSPRDRAITEAADIVRAVARDLVATPPPRAGRDGEVTT